MAWKTLQHLGLWPLVRRQHGVLAHAQLLSLGYTRSAIEHRLAKGRLHRIWPGIYSVGTPYVSRLGRMMAAVLTCGPGAVVSHETAAELSEIRHRRPGPIHVSVPAVRRPAPRPGIVIHRRALKAGETTTSRGIPVTSPAVTLTDLAANLPQNHLEAAINEADKLDLVHPRPLRDALDRMPPSRQGVTPLKQLLDRQTLTLTDSELERIFLPIARRAGIGDQVPQCELNGYRVDFFSPSLGLVIECDGGRYHRTPAQQTRDRRRDQDHLRAGVTPVRFTHGQIAFEPAYVEGVLRDLRRRGRSSRT